MIVIGIYRFGSVNQENSSAKQHKGAKEEIHKSDMMKIKILEDKAQVELLTGKYDSADKLYAKILDFDPEHGESLYVRGIIRTTRGDSKSLNEGIEYFKRALHVEPRRAEYYSGLAEAYQSLGERKKAILTYERVVKYAPKDVNAHNDLGLLYLDAQEMTKQGII